MKIERTKESFPETSCRPFQGGLERITSGEVHVGIYDAGGGNIGWRAIVKGKDGKHWAAEGKTSAELGDAMCAIMHGLTHPVTSGYAKVLPAGDAKELEEPPKDARYLLDK